MSMFTRVWTQWCLVAPLPLVTSLWTNTSQAQPFAYISNTSSNNVSVI
jgi:hypothetical protein